MLEEAENDLLNSIPEEHFHSLISIGPIWFNIPKELLASKAP